MNDHNSVETLIKVLNRLLNPETNISEDHVNHLVKYVTGMPEEIITHEDLNKILQRWFSSGLYEWERNLPQPATLTLALNVAVFLASQEDCFFELNACNLIERFIKILKLALHNIGVAPDVGFVRFLSCFLKHKCGCLWMMSTNYWAEIISVALEAPDGVAVRQECVEFISKLIEESININKEFTSKIVHQIISPIIQFSESKKITNNIDENSFNENCWPNVVIFDLMLQSVLDSKNPAVFKEVVSAIEENHCDEHMINIRIKINKASAVFTIQNSLFLTNYLDIVYKLAKKEIMQIQEVLIALRKIEESRKKVPVEHKSFDPELVRNSLKYYNKIAHLMPKILMGDGVITTCDVTLIFYQLLPVGYVSYKFLGPDKDEEGDVLRDKRVFRCIKRLLPIAWYHVYYFRDYMEQRFSFDYTVAALNSILKSKIYYTKDQAKYILGLLIYFYEDLIRIIVEKNVSMMRCSSRVNYVATFLETIRSFIIEFDLNWQDTVETVTLMETTLCILSIQGWNQTVIVNGLELISVAFSKHLSLNMAFLTDQFDGDVIEKIIEICIQKMNNESNEIRSSAIKVIESISNNVNKDFSSFKPLILENYLPVRIFEMAVHDQDPNVRAAAVRCLQEMASVEDFWNYILQSYDIYDQVCQTLFEEYHHIVRSETATLVAIIYQQHDFSPELLMKFYDTMSYTATEDTHPSVRRNALQYWKNVIQNHLSLQGMIDGAFPDVTFSKESRKIVILNDIAVKKRLVKVLYQLSETGCLAVLKTSLEDADEEVRKTSKDIVSDFYDLLTKYEVIIHDIDCYEPTHCRDSFCDTNDILEKELNCKLKGRNILQPEIFLDFVKTYFMPNQSTAEACQRPIIETVLKEILCDNYSHGLS